jgi:hypothetical protein
VLRALDDGLPRARRRWRRPDRCRGCRAGLDLLARPTSRAVTVIVDDVAPFTVQTVLAMARCPDCGLDNVPSTLAQDLRRATTAALAPHR